MRMIIADFGCAAACRNEFGKPVDFDSRILVGSREYNAPEINMDKYYNGERADLFSLGVILFVITMGKMPFGKAVLDDPYFALLTKKEKNVYWSIFSGAQVSPEFKGTFPLMSSYPS